MRTTKICITSQDTGNEIVIEKSAKGAFVLDNTICIAHIDRSEPRETRFAKAREVCKAIFGTTNIGAPKATTEMINCVLGDMDRVARE